MPPVMANAWRVRTGPLPPPNRAGRRRSAMTAAVMSAALVHAAHAARSTSWIAYVASVLVVVGFICAGPWFALWLIARGQPGGDDSDDGDGDGAGGNGRDPTSPNRPP